MTKILINCSYCGNPMNSIFREYCASCIELPEFIEMMAEILEEPQA